MTNSYNHGRKAFLAHVQHMIAETEFEALDTGMQYEGRAAERVMDFCRRAGQDVAWELITALRRLEDGEDISAICGTERPLPGYRMRPFPGDETGGRASALDDAALLIATLNTDPFISIATGDAQEDVREFLCMKMNLWLLRLRRQWDFLPPRPDITSPILSRPLPPPDEEKATLKTMFRALCHSLHIGRLRPSPYASESGQVFKQEFLFKIWPLRTDSHVKNEDLPHQAETPCRLRNVCLAFQEWYFDVGRTQIDPAQPDAKRQAESVFLTLREAFNIRNRQCEQVAKHRCNGSCTDGPFKAVPDADPFTERCRDAVEHILHRIDRKMP